MFPTIYLWIAIGSALGGVFRFMLDGLVARLAGEAMPWGTLAVNVTGCFAIGLLMTLLTERFQLHPNWRFGLVVGFLGGYTTFSSFEWETFSAVREGGFWIGLANVAGSVIFGYAAVWLGALLARR